MVEQVFPAACGESTPEQIFPNMTKACGELTGEQEKCEKEGTAERNCYVLTVNPHPRCTPEESGVKE